jgi:REP element-mobilizing transposase RayT
MMKNDALKEIFVLIIGCALKKYSFELISYQIMNNHFHFIIKTCENGASISRIMQYIKARFAEKYNRLHSRTGPFWNERFKDQIIEQSVNPSHHLLLLLWYHAFNPVRANKINNPRNSLLSQTF